MSMNEIMAKGLRLKILELLAADPGYDQNDCMLMNNLDYLGQGVSYDRLLTALTWLEEQGFITLEKVMDVYKATITRRGLDIATGRARNIGVNRPRPGE